MRQQFFDIQPFSLHDGPGIRTTVFMKGCPLRCSWCSNPEGYLPKHDLSFSRDKCTDCMDCVDVCDEAVFFNNKGVLEVNHDKCTHCGDCVPVCPTSALKIFGRDMEVDDIIAQVLKDKAYFDNSGGGITLSGGECMMQPQTVLSLLQKAKAHGLHTCIETSGFAKTKDFDQVVPYTDIFLFDYKITGTDAHQKYTGQRNELILENLEFLNAHQAKIILRCPIIPGINDTHEHFEAIVALSKKYVNITHIELMPYHTWGAHKYEEIGLSPPPIAVRTVGDEAIAGWLQYLHDNGCTKAVKG